MEKLFTVVAALVLGACTGNPAPVNARRQARVCVTNDGYALISVLFRQRDVSPVMFRAALRDDSREITLTLASYRGR